MTHGQHGESKAEATAADLMASPVIVARADAGVGEIARLMLDHGVGAAPVVDADARPIGMVSDGDLLGDRAIGPRRDWWLEWLAEGVDASELSRRAPDRRARDVMTAPLISVAPETTAAAIARILRGNKIKRLPVLRDGHLVGLVSRTDLLAAFAKPAEIAIPATEPGKRLIDFLESLIGGASLTSLGARAVPTPAPAQAVGPRPAARFSAQTLRNEATAYKAESTDDATSARLAASRERRRRIKTLLEQHLEDDMWRETLDAAEHAARRGEREFALLTFPSDLCSDGGRMIDVAEAGWEATLRGEAAEIFHRWRGELKPEGFGMSARIVSYEDGVIGDIGLFLEWGG